MGTGRRRPERAPEGGVKGRGSYKFKYIVKKITQEFIIISLTTFSIKSAIFWFKCKYDDDTIKQQVL